MTIPTSVTPTKEKLMSENAPVREEYKTAEEDFAQVIACETSGLTGSLPESDDVDLARLFIKIVNHEARHIMGRDAFQRRIIDTLDKIVVEVYG